MMVLLVTLCLASGPCRDGELHQDNYPLLRSFDIRLPMQCEISARAVLPTRYAEDLRQGWRIVSYGCKPRRTGA